MWIGKFKAAGWHGLTTLLIALLSGALVFGLWFPGSLSQVMPGTKLFLLVLSVELVLGPCMSLVIFNPQKSKAELIRDYFVIALIQVCALVYGIYSVAQARPIYIVFVKDRLEIVAASEIDAPDQAQAEFSQFKRSPLLGPELVCVRSPASPEEREELFFVHFPRGKDVHQIPKYFKTCAPDELTDNAKLVVELKNIAVKKADDQITESLQPYLSEQYFWLPAVSHFGVWSAIINKKNGMIEDYLDVDPY